MSSRRSRKAGRGDRNHVQAIVEILAKFSFTDFLDQVDVGCGDQADVDADGFRTAHTLEFAFLQDAKEFSLDIERQVTDFV